VAGAALSDVRAVSVNTSDKPKLAFADLLAQARPAERTVLLCLRGDLVAEFEELERQLAKAKDRNADSLAGTGAPAIAAKMEELRGEMEQYSVTFRLRTLPRRAYQKLLAENPPRRDPNKPDQILPADAQLDNQSDANAETFWFALARACVVEPAMDDEQWARLVDEVLSDRQFELLAVVSLALCRGEVNIPFSFAASQIQASSGNGSKPPSDSVSPSSASMAGSLATPSSEIPADD
jgi:hypothetical protein